MPTLAASVNGALIAQVRTDGYDVMSVGVQGTCVEDDFADLMMSGGKYPDQGDSVYLTWINAHPLKLGDLVEVSIQDEGETLHEGKTFEELFPDDADIDEEIDFKPTTDMFAELRAKPRVRSGYRFELTTSRGTTCVGSSTDLEHGFGFTVLWNSQRPRRASLSLHCYTIDSMEHRLPMRDLVREYIEPFTSVSLRVRAGR